LIEKKVKKYLYLAVKSQMGFYGKYEFI